MSIRSIQAKILRDRDAEISRELIALDASDADGVRIRHLLCERRAIAVNLAALEKPTFPVGCVE